MALFLIGIDDTDNETSPGTGNLARKLVKECIKRGMTQVSVTRHQFLLDPGIAYTSHNSGACVAMRAVDSLEALRFAADFVAQKSADGSDPGVCLAREEDVSDAVKAFGKAASQRILSIKEAFDTAWSSNISLYGMGGTCDGAIGALASVGQFTHGQMGRFIDMPGLRDLINIISSEDIKRLGILLEYKADFDYHTKPDRIDSLNWIRPDLRNKKAVLTVEWSKQKNAWIPVDRKKSRPLE